MTTKEKIKAIQEAYEEFHREFEALLKEEKALVTEYARYALSQIEE
jgi:hypothetical protein